MIRTRACPICDYYVDFRSADVVRVHLKRHSFYEVILIMFVARYRNKKES